MLLLPPNLEMLTPAPSKGLLTLPTFMTRAHRMELAPAEVRRDPLGWRAFAVDFYVHTVVAFA